MRSLIPAACLLGQALARHQVDDRGSVEDSIPSALITLYAPPRESADERELTFRLDVGEAKSPCGTDTNVSINGQRLDSSTGRDTFRADEDSSVVANWNFTCVEWDGKPQEQFLSFGVDDIDGVPQEGTGFVVRFQQTAPVWISNVEGPASMTRIHSGQPPPPPPIDGDGPREDGVEEGDLKYKLAELEYLRGQLAELEDVILFKEERLAETFGWGDKKGFHECDSIKCIIKTAYNSIHDAASDIYSDWMDAPGHGKHGKHHKGPHHGLPHWGLPHHGNHTHDNSTHPHPPHHPPFHHLPPFCKCPPPPPPPPHHGPPHHGPPGEKPPHHGPPHHGPPGERPPHEEPPKEDPPKEDPPEDGDDESIELELKGTHNGPQEDGPGSKEHPPFSTPPHHYHDDEEQPIIPPSNDHEGHPPHHGGPPDDHPPHHGDEQPSKHDGHAGAPKHGGGGPPKHGGGGPPPPPRLASFLSDPSFAPYKISGCVIIVALLLVAIHSRCVSHRQRSSGIVSRRRRRGRRGRPSRCPGTLFQRIAFWRRGTSTPTSRSSSFVDEERETILRNNVNNSNAAVTDDDISSGAEDNMSTTMEQEIAQFRAAASVVGDMIAAEEGRAQARGQFRELASTLRHHGQSGEMEQQRAADGFVAVPLRGVSSHPTGAGVAVARVPTDIQVNMAQLPRQHSFFPPPPPPPPRPMLSDSASTPASGSGSNLEMGMVMPPSPTAAFAEYMPVRHHDDAQLPAYDFEDGLASSHLVADGMMFNRHQHIHNGSIQDAGVGGGRYVPGSSSLPAGSPGSADAFGDAK